MLYYYYHNRGAFSRDMDTSAPGHFGTGAEMSGHFCTGAELSVRHFGTGAKVSETFQHRSKCKAYLRNRVLQRSHEIRCLHERET